MRSYIPWDNGAEWPDRVKVYRNLTLDCWSVCNMRGGKLYCHAYSVDLRNCKFRVQPAGRARVLKEKQKNVHAYVVGELFDLNFDSSGYFPPYCDDFKQAFYNPYKVATFVDYRTHKPLYEAKQLICKRTEDGSMNIYYA